MGQDFWGSCFKENKILKYNQLLVDRRVKGLANTEDISLKKRGMKDMRMVCTQTKVAYVGTLHWCRDQKGLPRTEVPGRSTRDSI